MAKPAQLTWPKVWNDATRKYLAQRELAEKAHDHWYKKNKIKKESQETPPEMRNLGAFMAELENQRKQFQGVQDGSSIILDSMAAIAAPLDLLMCQAGDIAGAFFPGAPLIFGAVMYIFNAGKGVKGYFEVIEQLFSSVTVFIDNIRIHVQPKRGLREELENVVIRALVKVLDILRTVTVAVKEKALKAFWQNLYKDKTGEATAALSDLESLAKERDSTVQALTLSSVDDIAEDITEIKETMHRMDGNLLEMKTEVHEVRSDVQGGFQSVQVSIGVGFSEMKRLITHLRPGGDQSDPKPRGSKDSKDAKEDRGEKDREALVRYLDPDRTSADRHTKLCQTTTPGTAEWILQSREFEEWQANPEIPILWVSGISGVGKSHLAAKMVEQLELMQRQAIQDGDVAKSRVASFFCDFETKELSDGEQEDLQAEDIQHLNIVLRTLAWQMTQKDRAYEKWLASRMPNGKDPETIDELRDWQLWPRLFENDYFASLQKTSAFLIIDGVDNLLQQCRQTLMEILGAFSTKGIDPSDDLSGNQVAAMTDTPRPSKVKVLILGQSQLDGEIVAHFESNRVRHIAVTEKENRKDVEKYILTSLRQTNKLKKLLKDQKFREETVEKVATASQGCFEMAALMVNELSQKDHLNLFSEALNNPPRNIEQILQDILKHFGHTHTIQEINDLNNLLAWVLYAHRPLTLAEINAAAGLESDYGPFLNIRDKVESEFSAYFSVTDIGRKNFNSKLEATTLDNSTDPGQKDEKLHVQQEPENLGDSEEALLRLTHSSIARFFKSAAKVEINSKGIALGVTADEAHIRLLKTCLKLLCAKKPAQTLGQLSDSDKLLKYAANNFLDHLIKLQPNQIPIEEKASIAQYLLQVFGDDEVMNRWLESLETLPQWYSMSEVDHIWALLSDENLKQYLTSDARALITDTKTSRAQKVMGPLVKFMARKWLQSAAPKREAYEWFYALGYLEQIIDATNDQITDESAPFLAQGPEFTLAGIHAVAEWAGLEKTALWHTQVAKVIFAYGKTQDALADCRAAVQLDKNLGDAYYYKAICHADNEEYGLAIGDMQEACRLHGHFEDNDKTIGARWISYWQEALENTDEGIKVLEDTLREYPENYETVTQYIQLATKTNRFNEAATCLRNLGAKLPGFLLSKRAEDFQRYIRRAAQMTRRVNSLKRAYQTALTGAQNRRDEKEIARALKALFMIRAENQEEDVAIELVKEVYRFEDGPKQLGDWGSYIGSLCELLFWGAHLNSEDSEPFRDYLKLLIYAEKNEHSLDNNALTYDNYIGGLFLGQLYRLHNRLDESKVYFKDRIALAMGLLEDYDVSNDWQAYDILSETLFKAGDEVNGRAARILFLHEWRKSQTDDAAAESSGDPSNDAIDNNLDEAKVLDDGSTAKPESHEANNANDAGAMDAVTIKASFLIKTREIAVSEADKKTPVESGVAISNTQLDENQVVIPAAQATNQDPNANETAKDVNFVDGISTDTPWDYSCCDGPCLRDYDKSDKIIHVCMNCHDTTYCDPCFNKYVFAGTLPYKKCDPTHQFVSATGPPKGLDDAKVVVGGSIRDREEWLNSIRTTWGLDEWHPVSATSATSPTADGGFTTIETVIENEPTKETGE